MAMINRRLNFVIPLERGGYVHAEPVDRSVYEEFFMLFGQVYSSVYAQGLGTLAGPKVAGLMLKRLAKISAINIDPLRRDMLHKCRAYLPDDKEGYKEYMIENAVKEGVMDDEDMAQVEGFLAFFTALSFLASVKERTALLAQTNGLHGTVSTSLNSTEYTTSLVTLMRAADTTKNQESLPPSSTTPQSTASIQ